MDSLKEKCNLRMKYFFPAFILLSIYSCEQKQTNSKISKQDSSSNLKVDTANQFLITDTSFGKINTPTTYNDLEKIFGENNMQDTINYGAEGMDSFVVTKIFSNTQKEIIVNWQTDKFHNAIATVDCFQQSSPYHTIDSLTIGSTLQKLVKVNGKKINFYGTGWDYGGLITSYNEGKFQKANTFFSLNSAPGASEKIMGDRELNTDMPLVKQNLEKLYISKISLSLHNQSR
jgi:hypothetical protein